MSWYLIFNSLTAPFIIPVFIFSEYKYNIINIKKNKYSFFYYIIGFI